MDVNEEKLLHILKELNIEIGGLNPSVIKAWFDTDCKDLLNWFCSNITTENYISPQEYDEYLQLAHIFKGEELEKQVKELEEQYPDLLNYDLNLFSIEMAENFIEILEEQEQDLDHQININHKLETSLLEEYSHTSDKEIQTNLALEAIQTDCLLKSQKLDEINTQIYEQIYKCHLYLNNFEFAETPEFINNQDIAEYEEKFDDIANILNATALMLDDNFFDNSIPNILHELQQRLFQSRLSYVALEMQKEALTQTLNFLNSNNISLIEDEGTQMRIEMYKAQQNWMLKCVKESSLKLSEQQVSQAALSSCQNELDFCKARLNYFNDIRIILNKILCHFVVMYDLYFQEKLDIFNVDKFFRTLFRCSNKNLQNCTFRTEEMMKVIKDYEEFDALPFESKYKLLGDIEAILFGSRGSNSLVNVVEHVNFIKSEIVKLEKMNFDNFYNDFHEFKQIHNNAAILYNFLKCGPSCQLITVPIALQKILSEVDNKLNEQSSSIKAAMQISQNSKSKFSEDKWLNFRNQLWIHFITDPGKMFHILESIKYI